ncbi:hypothetical protein V8C86DRAFT_2934057, partial [Haematococcus lacustris]
MRFRGPATTTLLARWMEGAPGPDAAAAAAGQAGRAGAGVGSLGSMVGGVAKSDGVAGCGVRSVTWGRPGGKGGGLRASCSRGWVAGSFWSAGLGLPASPRHLGWLSASSSSQPPPPPPPPPSLCTMPAPGWAAWGGAAAPGPVAVSPQPQVVQSLGEREGEGGGQAQGQRAAAPPSLITRPSSAGPGPSSTTQGPPTSATIFPLRSGNSRVQPPGGGGGEGGLVMGSWLVISSSRCTQSWLAGISRGVALPPAALLPGAGYEEASGLCWAGSCGVACVGGVELGGVELSSGSSCGGGGEGGPGGCWPGTGVVPGSALG